MSFPSRPLPSSFDGDDKFSNENAWKKVTRKLKEEPLIPLGSALTVYAFIAAYRAMRRGDSHTAQRMFRARVAAQAFTVVAMVAGGMYYNQDRQRSQELRRLQEQAEAEEKRARWIRELEARDEEDKSIRRRLEEKKRRRDEEGDAENNKEGSGVLGSMGLWKAGEEARKKREDGEKENKYDEVMKDGTEEEKVDEDGGKRRKNPRSTLGSLGEIVASKSKDDSSDKS